MQNTARVDSSQLKHECDGRFSKFVRFARRNAHRTSELQPRSVGRKWYENGHASFCGHKYPRPHTRLFMPFRIRAEVDENDVARRELHTLCFLANRAKSCSDELSHSCISSAM